jgi:hypothetical protein
VAQMTAVHFLLTIATNAVHLRLVIAAPRLKKSVLAGIMDVGTSRSLHGATTEGYSTSGRMRRSMHTNH